MIYKFIDGQGTFIVKNPHKYNVYFPLTNQNGTLLSAISPNLGGDIKQNSDRFITPPASVEDLKHNLLCRRDFFIQTAKKTIRLSAPGQDILEAGLLYHKLTKTTPDFTIEITNFIPYNLTVEIMRVKITNRARKELQITPTSFIPLYGRGDKSLRDHRHVSSLLNRIQLDKYGIRLKPTMIFDEKGHKINDITYFTFGFEGNARPPQGQFPTLEYFCGRQDLTRPAAIAGEVKPVTEKRPGFDGKEACGALRFKKKNLKPGAAADYFLITGLDKSRANIAKTFAALNSPLKIKSSLAATKKHWQDHFANLEFDFDDTDFTNWLRWVKTQPTLRRLFGCSFLPHFDYGRGGRGWRDLWQDALALLLTEPDKAKQLILNNFEGVRVDGSNATIITKDNSFISDRNRISRVWMDHGVWPYLTLRAYIDRTGDLNILTQEATYFRDHLLKRSRETDPAWPGKSYRLTTQKGNIYRGSVLEHILIQTLTSFFNVGGHNIIRLENADWNDGLDMAPQEGESVAFTFMYAHNLKDLSLLLKNLPVKNGTVTILKELTLLLDRLTGAPVDYARRQAKQDRLAQYLAAATTISGEKVNVPINGLIADLENKAGHIFTWLKEKEWLPGGFFNGYYDNTGRRVEGKNGKKTNMMLPSQVFAIMSGALEKERIDKIWAAIKKHLRDRRLNGFRLNTDFGRLYPDLGRAFAFAYGDKENGAFFNHMAAMLAFALYKADHAEAGRQVIDSLYKMAASPAAQIYPMLPEYFNNEGRGLYLYLTGSASWYIYTLTQQVLGIKFKLGDLVIEPKLFAGDFPGERISVCFGLGKKKIKVVFIKGADTPDRLKIKKAHLGSEPTAHTAAGCYLSKNAINRLNKKIISLSIHLE